MDPAKSSRFCGDLSEIAGVEPRALLKLQSQHEMGVRTECGSPYHGVPVGYDLKTSDELAAGKSVRRMFRLAGQTGVRGVFPLMPNKREQRGKS
jgi:hypothetical protein